MLSYSRQQLESRQDQSHPFANEAGPIVMFSERIDLIWGSFLIAADPQQLGTITDRKLPFHPHFSAPRQAPVQQPILLIGFAHSCFKSSFEMTKVKTVEKALVERLQ